MKVELVSLTQPAPRLQAMGIHTAEQVVVYCARVSNPSNQTNMETGEKLLRYCIRHGHWSVFEQAEMAVEIETGRDIAPQILRHRSFSFQEFSQRYAEANLGFETREARRQDDKNRQASHDDLPDRVKDRFRGMLMVNQDAALEDYRWAIENGIAKECARALLPLNVTTRLYMKGSVRSWITYFMARLDVATQKEHREVAEAAFRLFCEHFPVIADAALGDYKEALASSRPLSE